ncbi:MAG: carboxypeptidase regulatory-like domain-containing protein [Pyrinomonadaceae bacterium]
MKLPLRPKLSTAFAAAFLCCCCLASPAFAQFETATVLGTVRDSNGANINGANVTLKNAETSISASTSTDEEGNYQFLNIKIGTYSISVEAVGFSTAVAENVSVTVNARQRVDLSMQTGAISETVVVTGAASLVETDSSDRGQVVNRRQIVSLPLNGRSYSNLVLLAPGVRDSNLNGQREGSFNVNGLRSVFNSYQLDGIDNNAHGTSNQGFSNQVVQVSPDAVAEFKVQTNTYSAEFGRAGGAVVNASYRSGTNDFHGAFGSFIATRS